VYLWPSRFELLGGRDFTHDFGSGGPLPMSSVFPVIFALALALGFVSN
jgi:hypothetical protein